jgi:hypothetical protein
MLNAWYKAGSSGKEKHYGSSHDLGWRPPNSLNPKHEKVTEPAKGVRYLVETFKHMAQRNDEIVRVTPLIWAKKSSSLMAPAKDSGMPWLIRKKFPPIMYWEETFDAAGLLKELSSQLPRN